jgi:branched-chain amino acid transport system permease protein
VSDYLIAVLARIGIEAFVALSAYLVLLLGRVSFGQQGFFVIGAYASGMATAMHGTPLAIGIVVGAVAAGSAGALFALCLGRARGLYFAAGTLAFGELTRVGLLLVQYRVPRGSELVGPAGADGFGGIRALFTGGWSVGGYTLAVYGLLAIVLVALIGGLGSRWGEAARMAGEDETAARTTGIRVTAVRTATLVVAAALAGLGGALFAHYATYVEPGHADVMLGIHSLAYGLIGGLGTPVGPVLGVALDIGVLESARFLAGYRMIVFGGLVLAFLAVRPRGILDEATVRQLARVLGTSRRRRLA